MTNCSVFIPEKIVVYVFFLPWSIDDEEKKQDIITLAFISVFEIEYWFWIFFIARTCRQYLICIVSSL